MTQIPLPTKATPISSIIDSLLKTVDSGDESIALHTRIRIVVKETIYENPTFSEHLYKVKFIYSGKLFCFVHLPGLETVFVVMSKLVNNKNAFKDERVVQSPAFKQVAKEISLKYAECKARFDKDDQTEFIGVSTRFGAGVVKALQKMFTDLKLATRPDGFDDCITFSDSLVYRPVGVDLDWMFTDVGSNLSSMTIQAKTGLAVFRTDKGDLDIGKSFAPYEFESVLYFAYEHPGSCSFSLDPADPMDPSGPFQKKVYYPSEMEGTILGTIMWMADWKLKQLDQGEWYNDKLHCREKITEIPQLLNAYDFLPSDLKAYVSSGLHYWRFWFVLDNIHLDVVKTATGLTLKATDLHIIVKAMRMALGKSGLQDYETPEDDPSRKFAEYLTKNFDKMYPKIPAFKKLRDIAIMKAFADYIRDDMKVPKSLIKPEEFKKSLPIIPDDYLPSKVPRISTQRTKPVSDYQFATIQISGGIDLGKANIVTQDNAELKTVTMQDEQTINSAMITEDDIFQALTESSITVERKPILAQPKNEVGIKPQPIDRREVAMLVNRMPEESDSGVTLFRLFQPTECSVDGCSNVITYDMRFFDGISDSTWHQQINNWCTYEGVLYCLEHHPLRCNALRCLFEPPIIKPGERYVKWDNRVVFHVECLEKEDKAKIMERFPRPT